MRGKVERNFDEQREKKCNQYILYKKNSIFNKSREERTEVEEINNGIKFQFNMVLQTI